MGLEVGFPGERIIVVPQPMLDLLKDSPLVGDLYLTSIGHLTHAKHHDVERPSGAGSYAFLYCVWGNGTIVFEKKKFQLHANQAIIIPKGIPVHYFASNEDPWSLYWVKFDGSKAVEYARFLSEPVPILPSIYMRLEQRINLFEEIYNVLCGATNYERLMYADQILPHFLASFCYHGHEFQQEEIPTHAKGQINIVLQYMNDNLERKLTISELAAFTGFSESYFYRLFIREMSISPIEYFIRLKINKAAILLLKTSMSISQIAAKLSFGTTEYFSRTFKRVIGISPSEFRHQDFKL